MDSTTPTVVNSNQLPGLAAAALRYIASPLAAYLLGKGYITADQATEVGTVLIVVGSAVWGLYGTWKSKHTVVKIASDARTPDEVAIVK